MELPERHVRAYAVFVYADYLAAQGRTRIDISSYRHPQITLRSNDMTVLEPASK